MEIILREDVYNVGRAGDVVTVRDGYARNYLFPTQVAVLATERNKRNLAHEKSVIEVRQKKLKGEAEEAAKALSAVKVTVSRKVGEQGKLYGAVTALDIAEALVKLGQKIDRRVIHLPTPIRATGAYAVEIRIHRDVPATVQVEVVGESA